MLRGLITDQPGFRAHRQKVALIAAGVPERAIYDDPDDVVKSLRSGDLVAVEDFRGLGTTKREIVALLDRLHDMGSAAVEVVHMRRSDKRDGAKCLAEALTARANSR